MLNPNDTWARLTLVMYARPDLAELSDSKSLAIQSRFATRIARGIHKYDRERSPLLKFLLRLATFAELDVYDYLKRIGDSGTVKANDGGTDVLDYTDFDGCGILGDNELQAEKYLSMLIYEKPFGETIQFPLFQKDSDGRKTPIIAPILKMSEEELKSALVLLLQNEQRVRDLIEVYRPKTPAMNPAVLLPRFTEYYETRYKTAKARAEQRLYAIVFEKMILNNCGLEDVESEYLGRYGEAPPVKAKQARYSERGKRILEGFWDWLDEIRNDK
jgi:hypothetical protein